MIFNVPTNLPPEFIDHPTNLTKGTTTNDPTKSTGRSSYISWITSSNWLPSLVETYMRNLNTYYFQYDLTNLSEGMCQYTVYNEGDYYDWHVDADVFTAYNTKSKPGFPLPLPLDVDKHLLQREQHIRKLSFTLQLSHPDEYTGGELQLNLHKKMQTVNKQFGMLTVFDSRISHRVRKVKSGTRRSLVGWMIGPRWK